LALISESNESIRLEISLTQLITFFQHPSKVFAKQQLNLHFEQRATELDDIEPFEHNRLQSYLLRQQLLNDYLVDAQCAQDESKTLSDTRINHTLRAASLSGNFPEATTTFDDFEKWRAESESFSQTITMNQADNPIEYHCDITISVTKLVAEQLVDEQIVIQAILPIKDNKLVFYRSSSAKAKDLLTLYFHQLFLQLWQKQNSGVITAKHEPIHQVNACHGFYFDTKNKKVTQYRYSEIDNATTQLTNFIQAYLLGQQQALLLNAELAEKYFKAKAFEQPDFEKMWCDANAVMSLGDDPYMHYFWPECPQFETIQAEISTLYENMITTKELVK